MTSIPEGLYSTDVDTKYVVAIEGMYAAPLEPEHDPIGALVILDVKLATLADIVAIAHEKLLAGRDPVRGLIDASTSDPRIETVPLRLPAGQLPTLIAQLTKIHERVQTEGR